MDPNSGLAPFAREYSRRQFGQVAAGFMLFFSMNPSSAFGQIAPEKLPPDLEANKRLDSWLRINPDGTVEVFTGKVELGQGNLTALAQITAEELDVGFERIRMRPADTSHSPNESYTAGSAWIEAGGGALRHAAADARTGLLEMAAAKMRVPIGSLTIDDGMISSSATIGRVTYWELASQGLLARDARSDIPLKANSNRRIVGSSVPRLDIPAKLTGGEAYVQDMRLPGMLFGRVVRPPSYGAQLSAFDDTSAKAMPGIVEVRRATSFSQCKSECHGYDRQDGHDVCGGSRVRGGCPPPARRRCRCQSALRRAAGYEDGVGVPAAVSVIDLLLDAGAAPDAVDDRGRTALMIAADLGHGEMADILIERGANRNVGTEPARLRSIWPRMTTCVA